jgi:hypothetical protein
MMEAAEHLRSLGPAFGEEVRICEETAKVTAKPPAWEFFRFPESDGALVPEKGRSGELCAVIDGDGDLARIRKAGGNPRSLRVALELPPDGPEEKRRRTRVGLAGWVTEKCAVRLARGRGPVRPAQHPLFLSASPGKPMEQGPAGPGDWREDVAGVEVSRRIGAYLSFWGLLAGEMLGRRFARMPWRFEPCDAIAGRLRETEEALSARRAGLGCDLSGRDALLSELPARILLLVHYMEFCAGCRTIRHGDKALAQTALALASDIHDRATGWLSQVLPAAGVPEEDMRVFDAVRLHGPLSPREILRRVSGLKAGERDEAVGRLILAGRLQRGNGGVIRLAV